jgi:hypothetical protein
MANNPVTRSVRDIIINRSGGSCEICALAAIDQIHHRVPRGMGGTKRKDIHQPSSLLGLCAPCHSMIESRREFALDRGWLVRQGHDPAEVPVVWQGRWVQLTDEGRVFYPPTGRDRCERCGFHGPTQGHRSGCQVIEIPRG